MPYRIDLFAIFIFLGIVQALFLSLFFFSKENRRQAFNVFQGLFLLSVASCGLEVFLMYSGYIKHVLFLVDFSEPMALLLGPLFYFFVLALKYGNVSRKTLSIHLLFPLIYTLALIPFLIAPNDVKYNAWMVAYHPGMPLLDWTLSYDPWMFKITNWHTGLVLISFLIYVLLSGIEIVKSFREKKSNFWKPETYTLRVMRDGVIQILTLALSILLVKIFNKNDTGDHLSAAYGSVLVYVTSFLVIKHSYFFRQIPITEDKKYKASSIEPDTASNLAALLKQIMQEQKPYLQMNFSLPVLAQLCKSNVHHVSQVINESFNKSFFEWVADYRIEEAKKILKDQTHLKIEEVAEQVGYNAKSSFNTAFKRITGTTPSEFRNEAK
ncbi:MAG: AraC family transcriptional regulator [Cytophagia bacterium]|nr:AraC family transcriptional regulator [Cytophagia bacterium]NBW35545.1 AraC family transcriptional regulator [Cytophagia bacterium]